MADDTNDHNHVEQRATASGQAQLTQVAGDQHIHHYATNIRPAPTALAALPTTPAHLAGRDTEIRTVLETLNPNRRDTSAAQQVVVSGLPGVGKSALALAAAHEAVAAGWFPGGALYVALRGYDPVGQVSGEQAIGALLRALGVRTDDLPPTPDEQASLYRSKLAERAAQAGPVLLVADDAGTAAQILPLLPGKAHRLLVTSRNLLATVPARQIPLGTLESGPAADLIADTLTRARPYDPRPASEPQALADIVVHCGCLPLALTIAAALLVADPGLLLATLAAELTDSRTRLDALHYQEDGDSRTVRAAFDLSYRRLPWEQGRVFRLVSLNPGPDLSTEAATALTGGPARSLLAALARAGLISEEPVGAGRWRMHDLIRLYAIQLAEHGDTVERQEALDRLLEHYQATTNAADAHLRALRGEPVPDRFHDSADALTWLDTERPGLVAAVTLASTLGRHRTAVDLSTHLALFLLRRRHFDDLLTCAQHHLHAARESGDRHGEGVALNNLGNALLEVRRFEESITAYSQAVSIARETGDRHREGMALGNLGVARWQVGRFEEAITAHTQAGTIYRETSDRHREVMALNNLGLALRESGRLEEAMDAHTRAGVIYRELGDRHGEGMALNNLGSVLCQLRRFEEAIDAHTQDLAICRETGDRHSEGMALDCLGLALRDVRRFEEAVDALTKAATIYRETGDQARERTTLNYLEETRARMSQVGRFRGLWRAGATRHNRRKRPTATDPT